MKYKHYVGKKRIMKAYRRTNLDAYVKLHKIRALKGMVHYWMNEKELSLMLPGINAASLPKEYFVRFCDDGTYFPMGQGCDSCREATLIHCSFAKRLKKLHHFSLNHYLIPKN